MVKLQQELQAAAETQGVQLVSFSVEPDYDTPEILTAYANEYGADSSNWRFLTGERNAIWTISKEGFHLAVGENPSEVGMPILHASRIVLVDRQGRIRGYFDGMTDEGLARLKQAIDFVLAQNDAPTASPDGNSDAE